MKIIPAVVILLTITMGSAFAQCRDCVSVSQETKVLSRGKKTIFRSDIYYNRVSDAVVTHHYYPLEFIKISNRLGEMQMYYPETNTVTLQQNELFSTSNELLFYFIHNNLSDLGLSKSGFTLLNSKKEEGMVITTWQAPPFIRDISQVRVVFKDMLPVYSEYINSNGDILKKIFYSRYENYNTFSLPLRITEISFSSKTDSIISLSEFSNVRTSGFTQNDYFDFKIPDDAKVIH